MITIPEAKALARALARETGLSHSQVLEAVSHAAGRRDWNTFAATAPTDTPPTGAPAADPVGRQQVIPVLRVFDHLLAREFYCDFLGFTWDWEQRHEPDLPVYAQVSRDGSVLHLTEHHGDATPGGAVMIVVGDLRDYHAGLLAARHRQARPGIEDEPWGLTMTIADPFANRLRFWQRPGTMSG